MYGALASSYKDAKGDVGARLMGQLRRPDYTVRKELNKGVRTPEGLWGWLLGKSGDLKEGELVLADCEFMKLFRESEITRNYRHRYTAQQYTLNMECVENAHNGTADEKPRDEFLLYLRNIDRVLHIELSCRRCVLQKQMIIIGVHGRIMRRNYCDGAKNSPKGAFYRNNMYQGKRRRVYNCAEEDHLIYDNNSWTEWEFYDGQSDQSQAQANWTGGNYAVSRVYLYRNALYR